VRICLSAVQLGLYDVLTFSFV